MENKTLPPGARALEYLIDELGFFEVAKLCHVHRTTVFRWRSGAIQVPPVCLDYLQLVASGRLPSMGKDWAGWRFVGPHLVTPSNESVSPGEILGLPYGRALIREQQKQIAHLRGLVERLTREVAQLGPAANDGHHWPYEPRPRLTGGG